MPARSLLVQTAHRLEAVDGFLSGASLLFGALFAVVHRIIGPMFEAMYADFGGTTPQATVVLLSPYFAFGVLGVVSLLAVSGLLVRASAGGGGRVLMVVGIALPWIAAALTLGGAYLPIFQLAGALP